MAHDLHKYLEFMKETAYLAGRMTLEYYQKEIHIDYKSDLSPVTEADRKSEELIRTRIEMKFPGDAIIGEEFGLKESSQSSIRWYIDPIDGTKSFTRGVPLYSVLIGLEIEGTTCAGVAYFPVLDEMISAATGLGCWWNGRPMRVSSNADLSKAVVLFTSPQSFIEYKREDAWLRIMKSTYFQAGWGDAYGYYLVAAGRAELMLDPVMNVWDSAPFQTILSEAGGYFGDWKGNSTIHASEGMASNSSLLPQFLDLINNNQHSSLSL